MALSGNGLFDKKTLQAAIDQAVIITKRNIIKFQDHFPSAASTNGIYRYTTASEAKQSLWWQGFWCGTVWLLYEITGETPIRCYGEKLTYDIYKLLNKQGLSYSDIGFLTVPSCITDYKFTGSTIARETAIAAADSLLTKYNRASNIICSHDYEQQRSIISCKISNLLNVQILFYAWQLTGNSKYQEVALKNAELIAKYNISENGETLFRSYFDLKTGKVSGASPVIEDISNSPDSPRGYAWALYGLAVCYAVTGNPLYADKFHRVYSFLAAHTVSDDIYHINMRFREPSAVYDSTSSVIIAGALLEMSKILKKEPDKAAYSADYARLGAKLFQVMLDRFAVNSSSSEEGLLRDGYIGGGNSSIYSESTICGDFFYLEGLLNAYSERSSFWYGL